MKHLSKVEIILIMNYFVIVLIKKICENEESARSLNNDHGNSTSHEGNIIYNIFVELLILSSHHFTNRESFD